MRMEIIVATKHSLRFLTTGDFFKSLKCLFRVLQLKLLNFHLKCSQRFLAPFNHSSRLVEINLRIKNLFFFFKNNVFDESIVTLYYIYVNRHVVLDILWSNCFNITCLKTS